MDAELSGVLGGRYRVGDKIGRGAFGTVYKALDSESGEFVAIKRISTSHMRPKQVERLKAEGLLMKRLHHENIVAFKDVIEHEGHIHFILEYV
jgi:serine/threonine protein kinase